MAAVVNTSYLNRSGEKPDLPIGDILGPYLARQIRHAGDETQFKRTVYNYPLLD